MPYSTSVPMIRRAVTGAPSRSSPESSCESSAEPNACSAGQRGCEARRRSLGWRSGGRIRPPAGHHGGVEPADLLAEPVAVYDAAGAVTGVATRGEVYARSLWHGVGGV